MSYIGAEPTTAAFPFDQFSGDGSTTAFTLTYAPASTTSIIVAISGVVQNPNLYSVVGTTLTFSPAPPSGTSNISVLYLGLPVIGSSSPGNTAFLSSTDLTATASQTVFASAGSYTPGFVQVYRNGARLGNADFTATNGTTITLATAATSGDLVTIEYYTLTSLTNALPLTGGTVTGTVTFNSAITGAAATFSGDVGIGGAVTNDGGYGRCLQVTGTEAALELKAGSDFSYVAQNGTTLQIRNNATAGAMTFSTVSTERARFNATGALVFAGGTTTADGIGITFPATQSASTNANTLDDYEEGTWTPTGNGVSYTGNTGKYTKIGDFVFCAYVLTFPSTASASGAQIQGLPFAIGSQPRGTATVSETNSGVNPIMMALSGTTAFIRDADNNDRPNSAFSLDFLNGMIIYRV